MRDLYKQISENTNNKGRLIVCGAGTVGLEVVKLGKQLDLPIIVLEDREEFAEKARMLGADEVICMDFSDGLESIEERQSDYYVVLTREHKFDKVCIQNILSKKHSYVGMMASRNRASILKETLLQEGMDKELLDSIHSPIGLSINAQTPAEIAVSIMAEIINIRNSVSKSEGFSKEILTDISNSDDERIILATIIKRTGSAPRDVGTKMLIHEDGRMTGSVGGGWIEAGVIAMAKTMFEENISYKLFETDKDSEDATLCGGYETIYLEMI